MASMSPLRSNVSLLLVLLPAGLPSRSISSILYRGMVASAALPQIDLDYRRLNARPAGCDPGRVGAARAARTPSGNGACPGLDGAALENRETGGGAGWISVNTTKRPRRRPARP